MELRVLEYFLAIADAGTMSGAAEKLHLTQPTLSRQIRDLERELGTDLFIREPRHMRLTEAGLLLRDRAQQMIELAQRTRTDIDAYSGPIAGDVYIGAGETYKFDQIARALSLLKERHPRINFHILSGNALVVSERLDAGLLDFGLFIGNPDMTKYEKLLLPGEDLWGLLVPNDHPLAQRTYIKPSDLEGLPLICSMQAVENKDFLGWLHGSSEALNIVGTYNLVFNACVMVKEGLGAALCLDGVAPLPESGLTFVPLRPKLPAPLTLAWDGSRHFSTAALEFLKAVQDTLEP